MLPGRLGERSGRVFRASYAKKLAERLAERFSSDFLPFLSCHATPRICRKPQFQFAQTTVLRRFKHDRSMFGRWLLRATCRCEKRRKNAPGAVRKLARASKIEVERAWANEKMRPDRAKVRTSSPTHNLLSARTQQGAQGRRNAVQRGAHAGGYSRADV